MKRGRKKKTGERGPYKKRKQDTVIAVEPGVKVTVRSSGMGGGGGTGEVNHPAHYNVGKIEVVEFIEDQQLGFHLGNAVKYVCRAGRKDPAKLFQDLQKAIWYIRRELEIRKPNPRRPNDMNPRTKK